MKNEFDSPLDSPVEPTMDPLDVQTWAHEGYNMVASPEGEKSLEHETALIAIVENTGPIEPHNLAAYLDQVDIIVDGYAYSPYEVPEV